MIVVLLVIDQGAFGLRDDELPGRSSILATLGASLARTIVRSPADVA